MSKEFAVCPAVRLHEGLQGSQENLVAAIVQHAAADAAARSVDIATQSLQLPVFSIGQVSEVFCYWHMFTVFEQCWVAAAVNTLLYSCWFDWVNCNVCVLVMCISHLCIHSATLITWIQRVTRQNSIIDSCCAMSQHGQGHWESRRCQLETSTLKQHFH